MAAGTDKKRKEKTIEETTKKRTEKQIIIKLKTKRSNTRNKKTNNIAGKEKTKER